MTHRPFIIALAGLALATAAAAQTPADRARSDRARSTNQCFNTGSNVIYRPADENTIYVRDGSAYFRVTVNQCHNLVGIQPVIVNVLHGTTRVCGPLDLQLTVYDGPGLGSIPEPCIAQSVVRLTPEEVAAFPKKFKP